MGYGTRRPILLLFGAAVIAPSIAFGAQVNPLNVAVLAKPPAEQKAVFAHLLHDSGKRCGTVTHLVYKGQDKDGQAYWAAACSDGDRWNIVIPADPNANSRLLECSVMEAVTGDGCFDRFEGSNENRAEVNPNPKPRDIPSEEPPKVKQMHHCAKNGATILQNYPCDE